MVVARFEKTLDRLWPPNWSPRIMACSVSMPNLKARADKSTPSQRAERLTKVRAQHQLHAGVARTFKVTRRSARTDELRTREHEFRTIILKRILRTLRCLAHGLAEFRRRNIRAHKGV